MPSAREVHTGSGETFPFDRLLIATGGEPNRLSNPGFDAPNVFTLRTVADARAIGEHAREGRRAVIIGASFIGLEAAAALRQRKVGIDVVSVEEVPLEHVFGAELGREIQALHERNGVRFHLSSVVESFDGHAVSAQGRRNARSRFRRRRHRRAPANGAGGKRRGPGRPRRLGRLIPRNIGRRASSPRGTSPSYPQPVTGERTRIEHFVVAERQGKVAAANMLGLGKRFDSAPFFWTEQYGVPIRYVGRASGWDAVTCEGDFESGSLVARYFVDGRHCATATVGRDDANLEDELSLEAQASS